MFGHVYVAFLVSSINIKWDLVWPGLEFHSFYFSGHACLWDSNVFLSWKKFKKSSEVDSDTNKSLGSFGHWIFFDTKSKSNALISSKILYISVSNYRFSLQNPCLFYTTRIVALSNSINKILLFVMLSQELIPSF